MIQWTPRVILADRLFRLPVCGGPGEPPTLNAPGFVCVDQRWSRRDRAWMYYLQTPAVGGDYPLDVADDKGASDHTDVAVRSLDQLRQPFVDANTQWPRRWPLGHTCSSMRTRQTLQAEPLPPAGNEDTLRWWLAQDDATLWRQLPAAEFPRAHYVNVHQGCPICGTAIFAHHGFYPWTRQHLPGDLRSTCPSCAAVFPSNDLRTDDFSSGDYVDDGFGWFDDEDHVFLFAASSHRELVGHFTGAMRSVTQHLRRRPDDVDAARILGLMMLRWSLEEVYVAAAPQFRHGPSQEIERPWDGGPVDWVGMDDPIAALYRKGSLAYAIDVPIVSDVLAAAYDAAWPLLRHDDEWIARASLQGLCLADAEGGCQLIEEALCCLMQCAIDGGALSNKPRTSLGVLSALRALDRDDATDVVDWLYDCGPDRLRVFVSNNFTVDGMPPEATGGYDDTHTRGVFELEHQVAALRALQPEAYPVSRFPSITDDPRLERLVRAPYDVAMLGRIPFHFGDGGSSGVQQSLADRDPLRPLDGQTLEWAAALGSASARRLLSDQPWTPGTTIHDGVGFAILRTGESPERAAAGIVYGDAPWHRHQDLLDLQLYAFDRPFLSALGYPQSWAHVNSWEGNWATHNTVWSVVDGVEPLELPFDTPWHFLKEIAGRGRLLRVLRAAGLQIAEVEAQRWVFDADTMCWMQPGVTYRRLFALVEMGVDGADDEGLILVDLARIHGGDEHWRMCRGLEGTLQMEGVIPRSQSGTLAGTAVERGALEAVSHRDHLGLAWMDDVSILDARAGPGDAIRGTWTSCHDSGAHLDLRVLRTTPGTTLRCARATAVMDTPERSKYDYRTLAWQRPAPGDSATCVDLIFEPHVGGASLVDAQIITADTEEACGVRLQTSDTEITLYWSPGRDPDATTHFDDGAELAGPLAVVAANRVTAVGSSALIRADRRWTLPTPRQQGTIAALDRQDCTIDVEGFTEVAVGERIAVNGDGRGHTYLIVIAESRCDRQRLTLDMASVHGRARIAAIDGARMELDFFLITRTATLHGTRLLHEDSGAWQPIAAAVNNDGDTTRIDLVAPLPDVQVGDWVAAVDYVVGDAVSLELTRTNAMP
ncbi:MAG TPA: hypothetical protein QGF95_15835 [Candidatus Latescibacteria bacterium]|nr:hypothetical protein [Gemmatimonadaceae bacterium]MDP6015314.1 heparinase II/III family protein [Candidatus Latescibacterota bacterium]HJP32014.1 hypothetical protein [Candidatus Latescibacterota bacterium]